MGAGAEETRRKAGVSRESRRQLFSVLQASRGSPSMTSKQSQNLRNSGFKGILKYQVEETQPDANMTQLLVGSQRCHKRILVFQVFGS